MGVLQNGTGGGPHLVISMGGSLFIRRTDGSYRERKELRFNAHEIIRLLGDEMTKLHRL